MPNTNERPYNVYDVLFSQARHTLGTSAVTADSFFSNTLFHYEPMSYFSQRFYDLQDALVVAGMQILKRLGFNVQVQLPYGTMINYIHVLGLGGAEGVPPKTWGYLNDGVQTPIPNHRRRVHISHLPTTPNSITGKSLPSLVGPLRRRLRKPSRRYMETSYGYTGHETKPKNSSPWRWYQRRSFESGWIWSNKPPIAAEADPPTGRQGKEPRNGSGRTLEGRT